MTITQALLFEDESDSVPSLKGFCHFCQAGILKMYDSILPVQECGDVRHFFGNGLGLLVKNALFIWSQMDFVLVGCHFYLSSGHGHRYLVIVRVRIYIERGTQNGGLYFS